MSDKTSKLQVKTVGATVMRSHLSDVLNAVDNINSIMLIRRRNKADAALVNIELLEDLLVTQNKAYVESIKQARKEAESGDLLTMQEVFGDL